MVTYTPVSCNPQRLGVLAGCGNYKEPPTAFAVDGLLANNYHFDTKTLLFEGRQTQINSCFYIFLKNIPSFFEPPHESKN